jgi:hypothetical protein
MRKRPFVGYEHAALEAENTVATGQALNAVGDHHDCRTRVQRANPFEDVPFGGHVDSARSFIEYQEPRSSQHGPRNLPAARRPGRAKMAHASTCRLVPFVIAIE